MLLFTPELELLHVNPAHSAMTGLSADAIVGKTMFEAFPPNPDEAGASAEAAIRQAVAAVLETGREADIGEVRHDIVNAKGEFEARYFVAIHWPIIEDGQTVALLQRSEDITARVRERRLLQTEKRAAEQGAGLSFFSYEPDTDLFERSSAVDTMFGFAPGAAGSTAAPFFERIHPGDLPDVQDEVARAMEGGQGSSAAFDYRVLLPDTREEKHIRVRAGIERDPEDGKLKMYGAFIDMSDLEQARAKLEDLSERNAALVVESNHRIKNSLAIASAMLSQQMRGAQSEEVASALQLAATRIAAIADVHGELFKDSGVEHVDAGALIEQFSNSFSRTIGGPAACRITATTRNVKLPSRYAVTLALTLNELLTNAVKYGWNENGTCRISVALGRDEDGTVVLEVANRIAERSIGEIASHGVGTRLVEAFARQLAAEVTSRREDDRFVARFAFPMPD